MIRACADDCWCWLCCLHSREPCSWLQKPRMYFLGRRQLNPENLTCPALSLCNLLGSVIPLYVPCAAVALWSAGRIRLARRAAEHASHPRIVPPAWCGWGSQLRFGLGALTPHPAQPAPPGLGPGSTAPVAICLSLPAERPPPRPRMFYLPPRTPPRGAPVAAASYLRDCKRGPPGRCGSRRQPRRLRRSLVYYFPRSPGWPARGPGGRATGGGPHERRLQVWQPLRSSAAGARRDCRPRAGREACASDLHLQLPTTSKPLVYACYLRFLATAPLTLPIGRYILFSYYIPVLYASVVFPLGEQSIGVAGLKSASHRHISRRRRWLPQGAVFTL